MEDEYWCALRLAWSLSHASARRDSDEITDEYAGNVKF